MTLITPREEDFSGQAFRLYEQARKRGTWKPASDIDWKSLRSTDPRKLELSWQIACQGVYAEQAGLITAAELLAETEDLMARWCLATAVSDEAKHSEVFARYAMQVGGQIAPAKEAVLDLFSGLQGLENPVAKFLVHTLLEGFAGDEFTIFLSTFKGDLLGDIYHRVRQDESRHVVIGTEYLARRLLDPDCEEILNNIDKYSEHALAITGLGDFTSYAFLARLARRSPAELHQWFLSRHEHRMRRILSSDGEEVR
jgi:hypothetical protein